MICIVGVDAGTYRAGIAVLDARGERLYSGQVALGTGTLGARLSRLRVALQNTINEHQPTHVAVETPIRYRSDAHRGGSGSVGQGYGLVCQLADELGLPLLDVSPAQAKLALTGAGNASKELMVAAARRRFRLATVGEDESDGLGVCLVGWAWARDAELAAMAMVGGGER